MPKTSFATAARLGADRAGAAAVEFALLLPALVLILAGLLDLSRMIVQSMQVRAAAQAGAEYAQRHGWDAAAIRSAVTSATTLAVTADPAPQLVRACVVNETVTPTASATCGAGGRPGDFVVVGARASFKGLFPWPEILLPSMLTGRAMVRVQ